MKRDPLLDSLNREWANRSWTGEGEPYQPSSPIMPESRDGLVDLTRSGSGETTNRMALWRALRRTA